ncbi:hypothetical protein ACF1BN_23625 [Streptomyces sp. NPDC014861]|uniref:hypothetical protein n=1 Tax=Streptomyces sp. NPDC014861 TaxID=3364923 RepID=UPI003701592D
MSPARRRACVSRGAWKPSQTALGDVPPRLVPGSSGCSIFIRPVPILLAGPTALRLLAFLREEKWLYETPTRPLGFLRAVETADAFRDHLATLHHTSIGGA